MITPVLQWLGPFSGVKALSVPPQSRRPVLIGVGLKSYYPELAGRDWEDLEAGAQPL